MKSPINRIINLFNEIQFAYILNSFFLTSLFLFFLISGEKQIAIKLVFYSSFAVFTTSLLSANIRNISIAEGSSKGLDINISFRILFFPIVLIFGAIIYKLILLEEINMIFFYSNILVFFSWLMELILAKIDIKRKKYLFYVYFIFILFIFIIIVTLNKFKFNYVFYILIILKILILYFFFKKINFSFKFDLHKVLFKNYDFLKNFKSSLSLTIVNLLIKLLLYKFYTYENLDLIYFCISVYSLPGSLIINSYGASFFPKNKKIPAVFILLRHLVVSIALISSLLKTIGINYDITFYKFSISTHFIMLVSISSIFQLIGQSFRIIRLSNTNNRYLLIKCDIIFSILSILNLLIFIFIFQNYFIYFILINSIFCFYIYIHAFRIDYKIY